MRRFGCLWFAGESSCRPYESLEFNYFNELFRTGEAGSFPFVSSAKNCGQGHTSTGGLRCPSVLGP